MSEKISESELDKHVSALNWARDLLLKDHSDGAIKTADALSNVAGKFIRTQTLEISYHQHIVAGGRILKNMEGTTK